jgi:hypothetical protein
MVQTTANAIRIESVSPTIVLTLSFEAHCQHVLPEQNAANIHTKPRGPCSSILVEKGKKTVINMRVLWYSSRFGDSWCVTTMTNQFFAFDALLRRTVSK